jgi:5-methylcytosine-specific restriction endonuclease McrBC GTP-binding regulatory subunit McrB
VAKTLNWVVSCTSLTAQNFVIISFRIVKIPLQKILFGSPGTGKSYKIDHEIIPEDLGITSRENVIKTVFHPEYTYGDFLGKLVPITKKDRVEYNYYEGHFLRAISRAYKNMVDAHDKKAIKFLKLRILL